MSDHRPAPKAPEEGGDAGLYLAEPAAYAPAVTPAAASTTVPVISTLPPIATARPLENAQAMPTTTTGGSNIPVVNGVRQVPASMPYVAPSSHQQQQHQHHPLHQDDNVALPVTFVPAPGAAEHYTPPFFDEMGRCRHIAGLMLCYYLCTFFFVQPFFLGTLGVLTGFLGYYGSRPPIFAAHIKWIRGYTWMNYAMVVLNVWYLVITLLFLTAWSKHWGDRTNSSSNSSSTSGAAADDGGYRGYRYNEEHLGIFIALVVALNLILHVRGIRSAKLFYAELLRAGPLPGQRAVIVLSHV